MPHISNEILADYLSGKLPDEAKKVIDASAVWDVNLRNRIAEARKRADDTAAAGASRPTRAVDFSKSGNEARDLRFRLSALPLVLLCIACVGVLAGFWGAWRLRFPHINEASFSLSDGTIDNRTHLAHALEGEQDQQRSMLPNAEGYVKPLSTFKGSDGRYCREFDLSYFDGPRFNGIACRGGKDKWSIEILAAQGNGTNPDAAFRPASDAAAELMAIALDRIKSQPSLPEQTVSKLIRRKWRDDLANQ